MASSLSKSLGRPVKSPIVSALLLISAIALFVSGAMIVKGADSHAAQTHRVVVPGR
jgi:hypothetical protein